MSFHPQKCSNSQCTHHQNPGGKFNKKGFFYIKRLNQKVRRFQCQNCLTTFSSRSFKPDYLHKKMDLNSVLQTLLTEGNSIRACARILGMTYKNTYQKFLWLTKQATLKKPKLAIQATTLLFDEMETIHHTKCKPLSIAIAVNEKYEILDLQVAEMPAKGKLAEFSVRKYGIRKDEREIVLARMLKSIKEKLPVSPIEVLSDQKSSYRKHVFNNFPDSFYKTHNRSEKERHRDRLHEKIQKKSFDPMFALNQRCAKLRSDIRRLVRRSWCTTKDPMNLQGHLDLYIVNQFGRAF